MNRRRQMNGSPRNYFSTRRAFIRRLAGVSAGVGLLGACGGVSTVDTPQRARPFRIVFLFTALYEPSVQNNIATTRQSLRELGYIEGENVTYDGFDADKKPERFPALAAEIVAQRPDVILCQKPQAALALKAATSTIPIVFVGPDALGDGLVTNLARPGGNLTGLTSADAGIAGKRLEVLKESVPRVSRVAVVRDEGEPPAPLVAMQKAAQSLGIEVIPANLRTADDLAAALASALAGRADALVQSAGLLVGNQGGLRIAEFALENRWPSMSGGRPYVVGGGLMGYAAPLLDAWQRAAIYVDRILKGAWPGDLPVDGPKNTTFEVNLCTATLLGLTIPQAVLSRATEVIQCASK